MTDMYKPINEDGPSSASRHEDSARQPNEASRTLLVGVIGGIVSAAAYLIYVRLPDEQRERLHAQGRALLETRINELRSRFNI
jgi:hypothetical protein